MNKEILGWNDSLARQFEELRESDDFFPGRISVEYQELYRVQTEKGELIAEVIGKLRYTRRFPAVGDWVVLGLAGEDRAIIYDILPRRSKISRKVTGEKTEEQVIAANIDTAFIVTSLNEDFSIPRIERYLTIVQEHGVEPVVLLSKADLCDEAEEYKTEVEGKLNDVPVHLLSSVTGQGLDAVKQYLQLGRTITLLGSSGVGKSTLINQLAETEILATKEIRANEKGRHTTTNRQLIVLEDGGLIIDNPGMREIQLWNGDQGFSQTFPEITELATQCKFNDCQHESEPECAVQAAIASGELAAERLTNYRKMQRELEYLKLKQHRKSKAIEQAKARYMFGDLK